MNKSGLRSYVGLRQTRQSPVLLASDYGASVSDCASADMGSHVEPGIQQAEPLNQRSASSPGKEVKAAVAVPAVKAARTRAEAGRQPGRANPSLTIQGDDIVRHKCLCGCPFRQRFQSGVCRRVALSSRMQRNPPVQAVQARPTSIASDPCSTLATNCPVRDAVGGAMPQHAPHRMPPPHRIEGPAVAVTSCRPAAPLGREHRQACPRSPRPMEKT